MNFIKRVNTKQKANTIFPYLPKKGKILDFGCGDLLLAHELKKQNQKLDITGVDVVSFKEKPQDVKFKKYAGGKLPFKNNTFECVIAYHVFHHCPNPAEALKECLRVSKSQVVFVEPVYRSTLDIPFMKFTDWMYNFWKSEEISMPYIFLSLHQWNKVLKKLAIKQNKTKKLDDFPRFIPIGQTCLFSIYKNE